MVAAGTDRHAFGTCWSSPGWKVVISAPGTTGAGAGPPASSTPAITPPAAATVQHFLPGDVKVESALPVDGTAESACDWTIDQAPVYRLFQLNVLAYAPSGLASGNGSATFAAIDAYDSALAQMRYPPAHSADPRATVTTVGGVGNEAFSAQQVFRRGGAVTDVATVVVRYHNVVVTATMNGLQHSNRGSYGPVSMSQLASAALAFAQAAEATLH